MLSLTATELQRFMNCTGSKVMGGVPPIDQNDELAQQGNAVHWLIEQVHNGRFSAEELIDRKADNGVYITPEMVEDTERYIADLKGGQVEVNTSYKDNQDRWEIRGRADGIKFDGQELIIADFKYGWKIVEPEKNWTLISHALGFMFLNPSVMQNCKIVRFRIYQPRPFHPEGQVREWSIGPEELLSVYWLQLEQTLSNPVYQCSTGDHCYKCEAFTQCPAAQKATMNSIDAAHKPFDAIVTNSELSYILDNLKRAEDMIKQAINAYDDLALQRLKAGQSVKGYIAQMGKGKTVWKKDTDANLIKMITGIDVTSPKIVTPTQAKKLGLSEEVIESYTERPSTGLKLVRMDEAKKAEQLFGKKP